jgi:hypothetical protein
MGIIGIVFGALLILAAAFNWPIVVWGSPSDPDNPPPDRPTIGTGGRRMTPPVRVAVAIVGAIMVVLCILIVAKS